MNTNEVSAVANRNRRIQLENDRRYAMGLLKNVDKWWSVYEVKHPKAVRKDIVAHLISFVENRPLNGFQAELQAGSSNVGRPRPSDYIPYLDRLRFFQQLLPGNGIPFTGPDGGSENAPRCSPSSGIAYASELKTFTTVSKSRPETHYLSDFQPNTAGGLASANFWAGFWILDSWLESLRSTSPTDRLVEMAVFKVSLPAPECDARVWIRTAPYFYLPFGLEIVNQWFFPDDRDAAAIRIDLCHALQPNGGALPAENEFTVSSGIHCTSSTHENIWRETEIFQRMNVPAGVSANVYVGIRLSFDGADCRTQIGFDQHALNAYFGFRQPDTSGSRGLYYSFSY